MTFYEKVCFLIEKRGLSIRKVEIACGLANATIRRWETQSPRLESVIKLANYLNVSIDYLTNESLSCNSVVGLGLELNEIEVELIMDYRQLNEADREYIFADVKLRRDRTFTATPTAASSTLQNGSGTMTGSSGGSATA